MIEKVTDSTGRELFTHRDPAEQVFTADIASDVSYALQQVVLAGTGTEAAALSCPAAGKTGTATSENRDGQEVVSSSWFVGYTPTLSAAVMYVRGDGNDALDGYLPSFYGGDYPARTWTAYMQQALDGQDCVPFPEPAFVSGAPPTTAPATTALAPTTTLAPTTSEPPTTTPDPTTETTPDPTTTEPPTTTQPPTTSPPTTTGPPTTGPTGPPTGPTGPPTTTPPEGP